MDLFPCGNNSKNNLKLEKKKKFHKFVELEKTNPLICNTLHFDQYLHLSIRLNIFWFLANNSKTNIKFKINFLLVCKSCRDKSIDI